MSPRRVLITAASKGIGRAVADRVAGAGNIPVGLARSRPRFGRIESIDLDHLFDTYDVNMRVAG